MAPFGNGTFLGSLLLAPKRRSYYKFKKAVLSEWFNKCFDIASRLPGLRAGGGVPNVICGGLEGVTRGAWRERGWQGCGEELDDPATLG